jgi:molybdopterin molybdotransferase
VILTLDQVVSRLLEGVRVVDRETVPLEQAEGRVSGVSIRARLAEPPYDQSTRDGFVLGPQASTGGPAGLFRLLGEIPAGRTDRLEVEENTTWRIMTGALVPVGAERVIPQEHCRHLGDFIEVPAAVLRHDQCFIQQTGSKITEGRIIVEAGIVIQPEHLVWLAVTGSNTIPVYRRPVVGYLCSGSELAAIDEPLAPGRKISANRYLLDALISGQGAIALDFGIVRDDSDRIGRMLRDIADRGVDLIVSTGGVGPGKYDVFAAALSGIGGELFCRQLAMRPGHSLLVGRVGRTLYVGLPGPPSAVSLVFGELLGPVLRKMKGVAEFHHEDVRAYLSHDLGLRDGEMVSLKEGKMQCRDGSVFVRSPGPLEAADCWMVLEPGSGPLRQGMLVPVRRWRYR